jgi:hypothetical protein
MNLAAKLLKKILVNTMIKSLSSQGCRDGSIYASH